jgi:ribosomal protein L11 methyltransferase
MAAALMSLGGRGVEEKHGALTTYLEPPEDPEAFVAEARRRLEAWTGLSDIRPSWTWQLQEEWETFWRRGLATRRVTDRIVVHPSWLDPETRSGDVVIQLDPGMAFGTAEHGTTRGCLRLLDGRVSGGDRVLDVGCGSGILSIAVALLGARKVLAIDSDPLACEAARDNAGVNGVAAAVEVVERRVTPSWLAALEPHDGVVANLETRLILPLLPDLAEVIRPGGWLILSGILADERNDVIQAVERHADTGATLEAEDRDGEWWTGAFRPWRGS